MITKLPVGITLDKDSIKKLEKLAKEDQRSRGNLISVLIQQEYARREAEKMAASTAPLSVAA